MQATQNSYPSVVTHSQKGYQTAKVFSEERGVQAPHQAPKLRGSALGRQAPIMSGFENQWGLCLGQLEGYGKPRLHS